MADETLAEKLGGVVDAWFAERLRRPPLSQFTPAYNQAAGALADLKARLGLALPPQPAPRAAAKTPQPAAPAADLPNEE